MISDFWVSFFDVWMLYGVAQPSLIWESARRMVLNGLCVCHSLRIVSRYPAHYVFVLLLNAYDWGLNPMDLFLSFSLEQRCNKTKKSRYPKVFFRTPQGSPWFIEVIKWTLCILCFSTTNHLLIIVLIMWKTRAYRISRNRRHSCQDQVCPHRAVSAMVHRIGSRRSEYDTGKNH